jgi:hypothetical protein
LLVWRSNTHISCKVPSWVKIHFSSNLLLYYSPSSLNSYQMSPAYGPLWAVRFLYTRWQLIKTLTKNKICSHRIKNTVYWHMMLHRFLHMYQCFVGTGDLHLQGRQKMEATYSFETFTTIHQSVSVRHHIEVDESHDDTDVRDWNSYEGIITWKQDKILYEIQNE